MLPASNLLPRVAPREYLDSELPSAHDRSIAETLRRIYATTGRELPLFRDRLTASDAWLLIAFAVRMASLSVREQNEGRLRDALKAIMVEGGVLDIRESYQVLALIFDAASRIGVGSATLIADAMHDDASVAIKTALQEFPRRSAHDRSIEAMGFETAGAGAAFRYRRRW